MTKTNPKQYVRIPMTLITTGGIKASTIATYAALASYADRKGFSFPSVASIAKRAGLSEPITRRECNRLVDLGYLERRAHFDETNGQRSNRYVLTWQRDDVDDNTKGGERNLKSSGVDLASPRGGKNKRLTKSISNQPQQSTYAADIVESTWSPVGKTQQKESVIRLVVDALNNGIEAERIGQALQSLNQINAYVSAYSLSAALNPKPRSQMNADKKVDWSNVGEEF